MNPLAAASYLSAIISAASHAPAWIPGMFLLAAVVMTVLLYLRKDIT